MFYTWAYTKLVIDYDEPGFVGREIEKMNAFGEQGWEAYDVIEVPRGRVHYFKRRGKPLGDIDRICDVR